jgi:fluoride ion exporter CrcB/FEX
VYKASINSSKSRLQVTHNPLHVTILSPHLSLSLLCFPAKCFYVLLVPPIHAAIHAMSAGICGGFTYFSSPQYMLKSLPCLLTSVAVLHTSRPPNTCCNPCHVFWHLWRFYVLLVPPIHAAIPAMSAGICGGFTYFSSRQYMLQSLPCLLASVAVTPSRRTGALTNNVVLT